MGELFALEVSLKTKGSNDGEGRLNHHCGQKAKANQDARTVVPGVAEKREKALHRTSPVTINRPMRSKPLWPSSGGFFASIVGVVGYLGALGGVSPAVSTLVAQEGSTQRYVGSLSCAASSCHGGAGDRQDQWVQWNSKDVHRRAASTLTLAGSAQIAQAAGISDPANHARCTTCHAPNAVVPEAARLATLDRTDGVSCESCHGPAEQWIRTHTRTSKEGFPYANKLAAGLRDLQNPYVRANTCVACHQQVDRDLIQAGHPELIFELDGQSVAEPRHWKEPAGASGARNWWVGQAVALREIARQMSRSGMSDDKSAARAAGLQWMLDRTASVVLGETTKLGYMTDATGLEAWADQRARAASAVEWPGSKTVAVLKSLAGTAADFRDSKVAREVQARRAERLVPGLDRLMSALEPKAKATVEKDLRELFRLAKILADFDASAFASAMERFEVHVKAM